MRAKATGGEATFRVGLIALGLAVALSGFLPWVYDDYDGGRWWLGIEIDFAPAVMVLGVLSAGAAWLRWYWLSSVFAAGGAFLAAFLAAFATGGFFGEEERPQDVGIGARLALVSNALILVGGIVAQILWWVSRSGRAPGHDPRATRPKT